MSTINPSAQSLDFETIEAGIARGRRLQARAMASALKALFSRRHEVSAKRKDEAMPDCAAHA